MMALRDRHCAPVPPGTPPVIGDMLVQHLAELSSEWEAIGSSKIRRRFSLQNFHDAIGFVRKVADLAEAEDHHPDILVQWKIVTLDLSTHSVSGLSENDFILAAKIDALVENP